MPRYFFHTHHEATNIDEVGLQLPGNDAAWKEATVTVGQLLQDLDGSLKPGTEWRMEVFDEAERPVCTIRLFAEKH